jgi:NAD(P)-dependent dehydrogenase (short-subunit alcohol dehydrogenase family)
MQHFDGRIVAIAGAAPRIGRAVAVRRTRCGAHPTDIDGWPLS